MFSTLANTLSIVRIVLSPVFLLLIIADSALARQLSLAVFFIAALTDWYDGEIARRSGTVTNIGKFLDPLADKFLTSAAFIAFALLGVVPWWMVIVIVIRDIVITLLRSLAESRGAHIITSKSAQWKTFIQMTVLYYLLLLIVGQDVAWLRAAAGPLIATLLDTRLVFLLMLAVTLLTLVTGVQYFMDNWRVISSFVTRRKQVAE
ncbi:MAG: CDP-diacylglycerol--glycerol-3-phosphate 3-phosphatidyltransferase [Bacteroidota bacterium]|jgi:CDP-diacylglycerol--glycerol-3-phosphate 3-phosphatidyltransferase|nr:CDP-diacylglycerol--glycerol-3-phosphate 3-phosphatidyltransferase [Bacteroidota bacterium]